MNKDRLKSLLEHWIEHSLEHSEKYFEWAEKISSEMPEISELLKKAAMKFEEGVRLLEDAKNKL